MFHIRGVDNEVADKLSRNPAASLCDEEPEEMCIKDNPLSEGNSSYTDEMFHKYEFNIPNDLYSKIQMCHNSNAGHNGVEATMQKLRKSQCDWPYMRNHVRKFIHKCDTCNKNTFMRVKNKTTPFTTAGKCVMERLNVDTIGPFPTDDEGYSHVLVIIDTFSRWIELYPCKDATGIVAAKALFQHCGRFRTPAQLVSDKGSQFMNDLVQDLIKQLGTEFVGTIPYSKEENSIVERANKEVTRYIRDYVYDNRSIKHWSACLPIVQRIYNSLDKDVIGCTPAEILFGCSMDVDMNVMDDVQSTMPLHQWVEKRREIQNRIIASAKKSQEEHDNKHMSSASYDITEFLPNSLVYCAYPETAYGYGRPTKLHSMFKGPYRVIRSVNNGDAYVLRDLVNGKEYTKSTHLLKRCELDETRYNPRDVALRDTADSYVVENIVKHSGELQVKKDLIFTVKWVGYEELTEEPWSNVRDNAVLHEYLRSIGKSQFIPKKFL